MKHTILKNKNKEADKQDKGNDKNKRNTYTKK